MAFTLEKPAVPNGQRGGVGVGDGPQPGPGPPSRASIVQKSNKASWILHKTPFPPAEEWPPQPAGPDLAPMAFGSEEAGRAACLPSPTLFSLGDSQGWRAQGKPDKGPILAFLCQLAPPAGKGIFRVS